MSHHHHHRSNSAREREEQFVGPYKLEKTLGKGQTGKLMHINTKGPVSRKMGRGARKPVFGVSNQVRLNQAC